MYKKKATSRLYLDMVNSKIPKSKRSIRVSKQLLNIKFLPDSKRSQSAIEFVILIGVIIFFFTVFFLVLNESMSEKTIQKQKMDVENVAIAIQNEINFASESSNGYNRQFKIPDNINGRDYDIQIIGDLVYINTYDKKNALAIPVQNVSGQPLKGQINYIKKNESGIFLNL